MQVSKMHLQIPAAIQQNQLKYSGKRSDLKPKRENFEIQKRFDVPIRPQIVD